MSVASWWMSALGSFGGNSEHLRHVSWDEWFDTFDARKLNFLYQEEREDAQGTFFRLESPDREDG